MAAQRAITDMRKRVQAHIMRLPVRYFDSTKTGVLVSRIMSDAAGIRNLVGTGLIQLLGGFVTAAPTSPNAGTSIASAAMITVTVSHANRAGSPEFPVPASTLLTGTPNEGSANATTSIRKALITSGVA